VAYLGNDLQVAFPVYRNIDDISGSFNSSLTTFALTVSGVAPVPAPLYSQQCLISVGGVVQRPDDSGSEGFRLSGGNIIFASAPATGADFFGVILAGADYVNAGGNFPSGTAAVPSITFNDDLDTGIYNSGINQVSITTGGTERLRIDSAGQIESVSLGTAAAPAFSFTTDPNTGIYSPGADQVAISTNGSGRLFIDASGNVGIGRAANALDNGGTGQTLQFPSATIQNYDNNSGNYQLWILNNAYRDSGGTFRYSKTSAASFFNFDGAGGFIWSNASSGSAGASTVFSERMRLDSSGRLGLGTSSPGRPLHVNAVATGGVALFESTETAADIFLKDSGTADGAVRIRSTSGSLAFLTNTTERLRIDSSGRVGIGTQTPGAKLTVLGGNIQWGGADVAGELSYSGSDPIIGSNGAFPLRFYTNGSERFRCDSSGRVLVGTSTARANFFNSTATRPFQIETADNTAGLSVVRNSNADGGPSIVLAASAGTTVGSNTLVSGTQDLGAITFQGNDGTEFVVGAQISATVDGTPGANDMPTRLVFSTTADGASSPTERMRIAQNGVITIQNGAVAVIGTLTDAATITPDFAADCNFTVTLGGNRTIANPSNLTAGQSGSIFLVQDATGSRTVSWGSYWDFPGGTAPTLSTAANAVDRIDYVVRTSTSIHTVFTANYS
jgi:hypothetical protein